MRAGTRGGERARGVSRECAEIRPRMGAAVWEACRAFSGRASECIRGPPLWLRRWFWPVCTVAALTAFAAMLMTPAAYARTTHSYESVITEVPGEGPGGKSVLMPGPLTEANSMTVNSRDLYVAERFSGDGSEARTDQFALSASKPGQYEFVSQLPLQSNASAYRFGGISFGTAAGEPEMYIGQRLGPVGVDVFSVEGCGALECASSQNVWTGAGSLEHPGPPSPFEVPVDGVAVDHSTGFGTSAGDWASGDVFVADFGNGVIDIFEPQSGGEEQYAEKQVTGPSPSEPFDHTPGGTLSVAVSGFNGDLVVGDLRNAVYLFRPEKEGAKKGKYVLVKKLEPPSGVLTESIAVAVDDSNGEIYYSTGTAVYEFGPEGVFLGDITGVPREGAPAGVKGQTEEAPFNEQTARPVSLAVDPESHRVFVGLHGTQEGPAVVDVFGPDLVVPDVVTEGPVGLELATDGATGAHSWSVRATGTVNPKSAGEASCWFVWGTSVLSLDRVAPCRSMVPEGSGDVPVAASLSGLEPDTTYVYRLQARNSHGTNLGETSQDYSFTTPGPGLQSESVSTVTSSSASFQATIAPHDAPVEEHDLQAPAKSPTTYYFQYSTQSTAGCLGEPSACASVPSSPVSVGSGTADVGVSQHLQGLTAGSTYHYRLVAINEALPGSAPGVLSAFYGPDRTFTTQGPGRPVVLPDGRAWELMSPVNKHGAQIQLSGQAAVGGDKFTFLVDIPTESSPAGNPTNNVQVLSSRVAPGEWASVNIPLSHSKPEGSLANGQHEYRFFTEDLGLAVAESEGSFSVPEGSHQNTQGEWEQIVESSPVPSENTPYLRHNTTCSSAPASCFEPLLDSEDVTSGLPIEGRGQDRFFAGASPDGSHLFISSPVQLTTAQAPEGTLLYEWTAGAPAAQRLSLVNVAPDGSRLAEGLMASSSDGSRVFLGGCSSGACSAFSVRDMASGEAAPLAVTESGAPANGVGNFWGANVDGRRAFFTYGTRLRKDAGLKGSDLYVCELGAVGTGALKCALKDLTAVPGAGQPGANEDAQVTQVLGVSRDGSYVYFVAKGVLAAGATPGENVYVAHQHEGTWTTTFIASAHVSLSAEGTARVVSPDGRLLAFVSETSLMGYDNRDAKTGAPDNEVYLYDAGSGRLVCASCNPSGARPVGRSEVPPGLIPRTGSSRSVFDSGRLFFNSADGLVAQDTNGNLDVYEFEPAGVGSCTSASATFNAGSGACVGLISSGVASGPSVFLDASGTGDDAFFTTRERLVGRDVDTAVDIYDAHVCSGPGDCPSEAEVPPACTTADACRAAPAPQPSIFGAPSSATFSGQGNASPPPPPPTKTAAQIRAEKLRKALKACKKIRARSRRVACKRKAHRRYGPVKSRVANAKRGAR